MGNISINDIFKKRYNVSEADMVSMYMELHEEYIEKLIKNGTHKYKITNPDETGGQFWVTHVYDDTRPNNRKAITGRTRQGFFKALYSHYNPEGNEQKCSRKYYNATIRSLIEEVLTYKEEKYKNSKGTTNRLRQDYKAYYEGTPFVDIPIRKMTPIDCEDFLNDLLIKVNNKRKKYYRIKGVANSVIGYSIHRIHIIEKSPFLDAHINCKSLANYVDEKDEDRVYFEDERKKLFEVIKKHLSEPAYNKKADLIAILLAFKLALRIGEMVALKYSDISRRLNCISIDKMEIKSGEIVPHTKTYEIRKLPLSDYEFMLFDKLIEYTKDFDNEEGYCFVNKRGRRHIRGLDNTLRDLCDEAGIPQKSFHDIRRTVASEMHSSSEITGCTLEDIRLFLGHRDIKTTLGYIYNLKRTEEYRRTVHESLEKHQLDFE